MSEEKWDMVIKPKTGWFDLKLKELWNYRDLVGVFVKRDFVTLYKQTILGPLWLIIQPLFTTIVFTIVFGNVAKIPTDDVPPFIFYMSGNILWGYFSACLSINANVFTGNAAIFGKVYFPRLTVPISTIVSNFIRFLIQFTLFFGFYMYFFWKGAPFQPKLWVLALPLLVLQMAILSLGVGIIVSALSAKYRDLRFALGLIVQLWMYATPIVYPLTLVPDWLRPWYVLNPMVAVVESFRYSFLGSGAIQWSDVTTGWIVTFICLFVGVLLFNRVEKTFMDTV